MMYGAHLFVLSNVFQAGLEPAVAAVVVVAVAGPKFSQYNVLWRIFPQARVAGCLMFVSGWCFIAAMDEEKRRKEKRKERKKRKKIAVGKEGFPVAGPALMAVQQVAAIRCN
jgi:hypothetical protein